MDRLASLKEKARWVRTKAFDMAISAKKGHLGGAFSCTEILVALYYGGILEENDRFILSKGHSCLSLYAVLADRGFFPMQELDRYGKNGAILGGHPDHFIPGVESIAGSLGHGLGVGCGYALAEKLSQQKKLTFVLLGDAECNEGSVWEAASFAARQGLWNLIAIVDYNGVGATDFVKNFSDGEPPEKKWESFGWEVRSADGHSLLELMKVLADVRTRDAKKPLAVIAHTVKGKGVSFMENNHHWHHGIPTGELLTKAKQELQSNGL